jgi:hypothetical protein
LSFDRDEKTLFSRVLIENFTVLHARTIGVQNMTHFKVTQVNKLLTHNKTKINNKKNTTNFSRFVHP